MRRFQTIVMAAGVLGLAGCFQHVQHYSTRNQPAGTALPIEVRVDHKADERISGTVYYRPTGHGRYEAMPLHIRGNQLWAMLPTDSYLPDESVQYYIDVNKGDRFIPFGSPGAPYTVTFLDQTDMILATIYDKARATDAAHPVAIYLHAAGQPIGQPTVAYQMPGVPGEIRSEMEPDGYGNYRVVVPATAVGSGIWRYAIEVPLNGEEHRIPRQGYHSFSVAEPPVPSVTAEAPPE